MIIVKEPTYAKAIQMKATVANQEMNAALTIEQQAQIGQDFIADIMALSERGIGSETNDD
ncbi:hypothetical protein D9752_10715 [Lactiplantibacillus plantarum]|nr:hypothetical protein D9752_10715 [Lactiplantibacillus plantarum]